ncbi:hypothetical protein HCEG_05942 [Histoplasma capsulatum var. duboisii H88]|uniref:Uncharacterized protein n=2 Tax=Ajellomyces capsulatus TaxID=5037 RepID=F0UKE6_AJEC8|nr:hypothetical protein HCDG_06676 [Histoplasma capsulatum H143]EGC46727.1 hypothetical protein HCEG_05942 [Histoplasma capsulatum var. duboisii H88]
MALHLASAVPLPDLLTLQQSTQAASYPSGAALCLDKCRFGRELHASLWLVCTKPTSLTSPYWLLDSALGIRVQAPADLTPKARLSFTKNAVCGF